MLIVPRMEASAAKRLAKRPLYNWNGGGTPSSAAAYRREIARQVMFVNAVKKEDLDKMSDSQRAARAAALLRQQVKCGPHRFTAANRLIACIETFSSSC